MRHRHLPSVVTVILLACSGFGRELSPIRLEAIVTLGATSGDGAIATTPVVGARHPGGFRIVVPAASAIGTLPLIFDDDGHFLGSLRGDSSLAGTFNGPMFSRLGPGDSIWVFDNSSRVLIFSPQRKYVRSVTLPGVHWDAAVLRDGRVVVSGDSESAVQLFDPGGVLVRKIGVRNGGGRPADESRTILLVRNGSIWTTTTVRAWRLEHWDTAGARLGAVEPTANWFPRADTAQFERTRATDRPAAPRIVAAWTDVSGRLWVVGEVADQHWVRGVAATDGDKYYDTIVDVRDPYTGKLLATTRFDNHYASMAEPGVLVHEIRTSAGWLRAELFQVVFDEPTSRP